MAERAQESSGNDSQNRSGLKQQQGGKSRRWFQKKRITIPVIFILILAAAIFLYWDIYLRGFVSTDDAYIEGYRAAISSKIPEQVIELKVDEGDTIQQGQLLAVLDDRDLLADKAEAEANIAYMEATAAAAKINIERTSDDFKRAKTQFEGKVISKEEYDHTEKALKLAQKQYDTALTAIKLAESRLNVIDTSLTYTKIYAPTDGVIAKRWVLAGDVVAPGQPIFTAFNLKDLWVTANFEETKIASFNIGDPVQISVDAFSSHDFKGRVLIIGAATASQFSLIPPNNASGNFTKVTQRVPVKISLERVSNSNESKSLALVPGMSVVVKIDTRKNAD